MTDWRTERPRRAKRDLEPARPTPQSGPVAKVRVGDTKCVCGHVFDHPLTRAELVEEFRSHREAVREFYPDNPCSSAPLREGSAPVDGCPCAVCSSLRLNRGEPVKPYTPEWNLLMVKSGAARG